MRNRIFQFLWYKIISKLCKPKDDLNGFYRFHSSIKAQILLAKLFGRIHGVLLGDSEHGQFNNYETMKKFSKLTLNLAVGGTTPWDMYDYFTGSGKDVYQKIKDIRTKKFISTGGNCSLRNRMDEIPAYLEKVKTLFPESFIMLIPPVYTGILEKIYNMAGIEKDREQIIREIDLIRRYQKSIWEPQIIDIYSPFLDTRTGDPLFGVLRDPVHISYIVVDMIQKIYNKLV